MSTPLPPPQSPPWNENLKLVVSLTLVGLVAGFMIAFRSIIGPLMLAFMLTYLLYPLTAWLSQKSSMSWKLSANLIFLLLLALLIGLSTVAGVAIVQQVQSLLGTINNLITDPPAVFDGLLDQTLQIGMFEFQISDYIDVNAVSAQLVSATQSLIGRIGALLSSFAAGAASTLGWGFFVLLITYFVLVDARTLPDLMKEYENPAYTNDFRRMFGELGHIWNAFLRGQLLIVLMVILTYSVLFSVLGVRYAIGLAVLAGLARFIPYVGPLATNLTTFMVAFFQPSIPFGLEPIYFAILVIGITMITDQIYDNMVSPRIMGDTLGVHPAAVLIAAIIAASLIGFVGLLLAAPVMATVQLFFRYAMRKLLDLDPWPQPPPKESNIDLSLLERLFRRLRAWWKLRRAKH